MRPCSNIAPSCEATSADNANSSTPDVPRSSRCTGHTVRPSWSRSNCSAAASSPAASWVRCTSKPGGSGIGAYQARDLLREAGGDLVVITQPGAGTTIGTAIAAKAAKEVSYHRKLASDWVVRLGDGTEESHARMSAGLDWMSRFADELFAMDEIDAAAIYGYDGVGVTRTLILDFAPGDAIEIATPGGGGYGEPESGCQAG